jgi:hypothetical protein
MIRVELAIVLSRRSDAVLALGEQRTAIHLAILRDTVLGTLHDDERQAYVAWLSDSLVVEDLTGGAA